MENDGLRYGTHTSSVPKNDVASKAEVGGKYYEAEATEAMKAELKSFFSLNPDEGKQLLSVTLGEKGDIDLIDLRGLDFNDPLWDELLDQLTWADYVSILKSLSISPRLPTLTALRVLTIS